MAEEVVVLHRSGGSPHVAVARVDNVLYTDQLKFSPLGARRVFWLLDYDAQIVYEPFGWTNEWYIDLVQIQSVQAAQGLIHHVRDMEVDIVVEGMGPTYRLIDLERFGQRALAGELTVAEVAEVLHKTQAFLDAFLHRGAPWPPPPIRAVFSPTHEYP
jgi:hypothetical protein